MTTPVSDKHLASLIQTELSQSNSWAGSEWRESIKQSLNYLLCQQKGDETEGRSQIQSGDVADMLDHVHSELQPMYAVDNLWEIGEEGPDDEEKSHAETEAVNWYWRERLRGFDVLDEAVQDGLLSRNGYLKVWYEESWGLCYEETIEGDQQQVNAELTQLDEGNEIVVLEEEETQAAVTQMVEAIGPDGLTPILGEIEIAPAQYRVKVKVTPQHQEVKAVSVAPEDMFVSRDAVGSNMQHPRFVAQRRRMSRMDVTALGFDAVQVDRMPMTSTHDSDVKTSRKSDYNTYQRQGADKSGQAVDLFEAYYRIDRDRDGRPELWKCFFSSGSGGEILNWADSGEPALELVRVRPFASGSPMKVAHRHDGRSLYDKEKQIEDAKRSLMRQMLDNLELGNDSGAIIGPSVEREDLEETDTVRYIRAGNVDDIRPLPYTNTAPASLAGLQYLDKMRKERGGGAMDAGAESMPVTGPAHSTERILSAMERVVGMYARNFARTMIRDAGILLHQQLQLLPGKVSYQEGSDWQETEPRYWVQRTRINVRLGESQGEKMRKGQALNRVIEIQGADREKTGHVLTNEEYEARVDLAKNAGLDQPSQYFIDPQSDKGKQMAQQRAQQAQMAEQQQQAGQQMLVAAQMQVARMQEETKRAAEQIRAINEDKQRFAEMLQKAEELQAKYVEMELKYAADVPGQGIEGEETVIAFTGS